MDRATGQVELISKSITGTFGNGLSSNSTMTPDGRFILSSDSSNLVVDDSNFARDLFVYDRQLQKMERLTVRIANIDVGLSTLLQQALVQTDAMSLLSRLIRH